MNVSEGLDDLGAVGLISFRESPELNYPETRMSLVYTDFSIETHGNVSLMLAAAPSLVGPES